MRAIDFSDTPDEEAEFEEASMKAWRMICEIEGKENVAELEDAINDVLKSTALFYEDLCDLVGVEVPAVPKEGDTA